MGVWIETFIRLSSFAPITVTPFVGVWIETDAVMIVADEVIRSHPSWVCGLKLPLQGVLEPQSTSHPSWVCGLKHVFFILFIGNTRHTLRGCVD